MEYEVQRNIMKGSEELVTVWKLELSLPADTSMQVPINILKEQCSVRVIRERAKSYHAPDVERHSTAPSCTSSTAEAQGPSLARAPCRTSQGCTESDNAPGIWERPDPSFSPSSSPRRVHLPRRTCSSSRPRIFHLGYCRQGWRRCWEMRK